MRQSNREKLLLENKIRKLIEDGNIPTDEKVAVILGSVSDYLHDRSEEILGQVFCSKEGRKTFSDKLFQTLIG